MKSPVSNKNDFGTLSVPRREWAPYTPSAPRRSSDHKIWVSWGTGNWNASELYLAEALMIFYDLDRSEINERLKPHFRNELIKSIEINPLYPLQQSYIDLITFGRYHRLYDALLTAVGNHHGLFHYSYSTRFDSNFDLFQGLYELRNSYVHNCRLETRILNSGYAEYVHKRFRPIKALNAKSEFPDALKAIEEKIRLAEQILGLDDDWDQQDSEKISPETLKKSTDFLKNYSLYIYSKYDITITAPDITPGYEGSIDISWKTDKARMLITIKAASDNAMYYGDHYEDKMQIKGTFPLGKVQEHIAAWMQVLQ